MRLLVACGVLTSYQPKTPTRKLGSVLLHQAHRTKNPSTDYLEIKRVRYIDEIPSIYIPGPGTIREDGDLSFVYPLPVLITLIE